MIVILCAMLEVDALFVVFPFSDLVGLLEAHVLNLTKTTVS